MLNTNTDAVIQVLENKVEFEDYRSIIFDRPLGFNYESGSWIDIESATQILAGGKTYSLSSSPTESQLMITFKDGFSQFKKALSATMPGDQFKIIGHGNDYRFSLHPPGKTSTYIAGGAGIAPFRSVLKEMADNNSSDEISLLYLSKSGKFLFASELNEWSSQLENLKVRYLVTSQLTEIDKTKFILSSIEKTEQIFYIAGSKDMIESTENLLINSGVELKNIKKTKH